MARKPNPITKYIVTSYIPDADLCYDFIRTLDKCAQIEGAKLLIGQCKPNYLGDLETPYEHMIQLELGDRLVTKFTKLNDKLAIHDFHESVNVVDPLAGIESDVADRGCLIVPFPRHRFKTVPRMLRESGAPRAAWCTGSISHPYYKNTKSGSRMARYHIYGALMIEIINDHHFNVRQLTWDGKGFYDLDKYYTQDGVTVGHSAAALSMGDDHAVFQDPHVMDETYNLIELIKPKYLFRHDTFDACSVTHHLDGKKLTKSLVNLSLEEEARITARCLQHVESKYPGTNQVMVASNHPEHLDRYLDEGRYKDDTTNHVLALELAWQKAQGKNVVEYLLNKFQPLNKTQFLARKQSFKVHDIEMGDHGDEGANGARGSTKEKGIVYSGKSVTGHCLTEDHSVNVFGRGFVKIREVKTGDIVLSYDAKTNTNVWTKVIDTTYVTDYSGTMVELGFDKVYKQDVTLNHHFFTKSGDYVNLQDLLTNYKASDIPLFADAPEYKDHLTDLQKSIIRLRVAVAADGSIADTNVRFHLKKPAKITRLKKLLKDCRFEYSEKVTTIGTTKITILRKSENAIKFIDRCMPDKSLPREWIHSDLSIKSVVMDECVYWDGSKLSHGARQFCTSKQHEANLISSIANELGYRTSMLTKKEGGFTVTFNVKRVLPHQLSGSKKDGKSKFTVIPRSVESIEVFCLTTEFNNFWVKNEETGQVSLTGNTHSPEVGVYGNYVNGTSTFLSLNYTKDSGSSSWLNTHTIVYPNGKLTHYHIIPE